MGVMRWCSYARRGTVVVYAREVIVGGHPLLRGIAPVMERRLGVRPRQVGQVLQGDLLQPGAAAVAAPTIGRDQQLACAGTDRWPSAPIELFVSGNRGANRERLESIQAVPGIQDLRHPNPSGHIRDIGVSITRPRRPVARGVS